MVQIAEERHFPQLLSVGHLTASRCSMIVNVHVHSSPGGTGDIVTGYAPDHRVAQAFLDS
jgi:hypothetical protein